MPVVSLETLPDASRVWVFGSDRPIVGEAAERLLHDVDEHLKSWKAHGAPLTVSSQWRDDRFLVVAVDQSETGATGCSIDTLFRVLKDLQGDLGANLVGGGRVYYRDANGVVQSAERAEIEELASSGAITKDTVIFDTSLTDLGAWRRGFETPAKDSWVKDLLA